MTTDFEKTLSGCRQALLQGKYLIERLSDEQYVSVPQVSAQSTVGQHFRHIFDMWFALYRAVSAERPATNHIDYDVRRRGADVETSRQSALQETEQLLTWLEQVHSQVPYSQTLTVSSEVGLHESMVASVVSSFGRELMFVSSHAIHHFALIKQIAASMGVVVDKNLGIAPATRSHLREIAE